MTKPILSLLLFTISFSIYSQTIHEVGITLGVADSQISMDYQYGEEDYFSKYVGFKTGFNAHALVNLKERKHFHYQVSLGYVEKGGEAVVSIRNDGTVGPSNFSGYDWVKTHYNYISLAAGGVGKIRWRNVELNTNAKPRLDVLVYKKEPNILVGDIGKDIKTINVGMVAGLGFKWYLSNVVAFTLQYDRNFNLNPINNTEYSPGTFGLEMWDSTKFINLGFTFKIKESQVG